MNREGEWMHNRNRCTWVSKNPLMIEYHDREWGQPLRDDRKLFEYLVLDAFQAGLSWETIINKRENFRRAFNDFDPEQIALWTDERIEELLLDAGIIRNRLKVQKTRSNARAFLAVQKEFGSFSDYIWSFTEGKTIVNKLRTLKEMPVSSEISDAMSRDLKKRGFSFVGTTICYAFMQAAGLVNDHLMDCFRYEEVQTV